MVGNSIGLQGKTGNVTTSLQHTVIAVPTACGSAIGIGLWPSVTHRRQLEEGEEKRGKRGVLRQSSAYHELSTPNFATIGRHGGSWFAYVHSNSRRRQGLLQREGLYTEAVGLHTF